MSEDESSAFLKGLKRTNRRFEEQWLTKFSHCLDEVVGRETKKKMLHGSRRLALSESGFDTIAWTKEAIDRLDALVDEKNRRRVMTGCACQFPEQRLTQLRTKHLETHDVDIVQKMLKDMFVSDLKQELGLSNELVKEILARGWGVAGVRRGNTIIATKLPFELGEYLQAREPRDKRYHYCHCPRIREAIRLSGSKISKTYCYCGAGFYMDIWERILQRPVEAEVLETVLQGSDVCRIAIRLPREA